MLDVRRIGKKFALQMRQYLGRTDVVERHVRGEGLEIGALQDPMPLPRGARARYVDLLPTAELRALYPRKAARHLVEVDVVCDGQTLAPVADGSQDFVVSNHFLEHCEDPIGALSNMLRVVRPGGVVYLSIPDKRKIFDRHRPATTLAHLLDDHRNGPERSRRQHYVEVVQYAEQQRDVDAMAARVEELMAQRFPIHFHSWTPREFLELLLALPGEVGLCFELLEFRSNEKEMVVVLQKPGQDA